MIAWQVQTFFSGDVYMLMFGLTAAVTLVFGLHSLLIAWRQRTRLSANFPFWLGLMLLLSSAITNFFFAYAFFVGAAHLTWHGTLIFGPGVIVTIVAFLVWVNLKGSG